MSLALVILFALLSLCPTIIVVDGAGIPGLIPLLLAAGLVVVSMKLPPGETQHMCAVVSRPFVIVAALPAALMMIQMLPIAFLANPVWTSVSAGFPQGITGRISVDIGATAVALAHYLSAVGAVVLTAAVAINRERAEFVLIAAVAATVMISLASLGHDLFGSSILARREEALDCACVGVTLSAACAIFVFERFETRRYKSGHNQKKFLVALLASLAAFVTCASAVAATRSGSLAFAAASGFLTFCAVVVIRRYALGRLGAVAIGVTATIIAVALVTVAAGDPDPRFAFVKKGAAAIELTQRILNDAPFLGDGAGSFAALLPIYQPGNSSAGDFEAVTAAAKLSIEMGKPTLWIAIIAASFAVFTLLRGAAHRGRDSFYAAGAGASLVTLMNLAFVNVGLVGAAAILLSAIILGLGLTQSRSRTATESLS
jgi:hypothetical protein